MRLCHECITWNGKYLSSFVPRNGFADRMPTLFIMSLTTLSATLSPNISDTFSPIEANSSRAKSCQMIFIPVQS